MTILLIVSHLIVFGGGIYFHEKYWPRLQEVLRQVW